METIHDHFGALDADINFLSSDKTLFKLHQRNMLITSGGSPGPEIDAAGELVRLDETSAVLEFVFPFMYPERHPDLPDNLEFALLMQVAEVAQKYDVYAATDACGARFNFSLLLHRNKCEKWAGNGLRESDGAEGEILHKDYIYCSTAGAVVPDHLILGAIYGALKRLGGRIALLAQSQSYPSWGLVEGYGRTIDCHEGLRDHIPGGYISIEHPQRQIHKMALDM